MTRPALAFRQSRLQHPAEVPEQTARSFDPPHRAGYLNIQSAMRYIDVTTREAVYYHIRENGLPTKRIGRSYRFDPIELDAWLQSRAALNTVQATTRVKGL